MDFDLSEDQRAVLEAADALLARHAGPARAIELARAEAYDDALDVALADAGFAAMALADETGALETALVVERIAKAAGTSAFAASALVAPLVAGRALPGPVALARADEGGPIRFAAAARTLLVLDGDVARATPLAPGEAAPVASNFGYPVGRVSEAARRRGEPLGAGSGERLLAWWRVALGLEALGAMDAALRFTVAYVTQREQFGRPIGSFQAVQHRLADCAVRVEGARWLLYEAAAAGAPAESAACAASFALAAAGQVHRETHQLSGAIGYTTEHDLHVWSMRLVALRLELGGAGEQLRALARALASAGVIAALELDAERAAVRDAVATWCAANPARVFEPERWRTLGSLGVLAAGADGESGARELVATCEALGAAAAAGPLVETVIALRVLPEAERAGVAAGERIASVGVPPLLPFAAEAAHFVELDAPRAFAARPAGAVEALVTLAGDPWGRLELLRGEELPGAAGALSAGRLACAALLAAAGRRALELAAEHARSRRQFGRAIGEFQAVAHPLADAWIRIAAAEMLARAAAHASDAGEAAAPALAAAAWLSARGAALAAVSRAHQTFGAAGITLEGPLFSLTRRVRQWASLPLGEEEAWRLVRVRPPLPLFEPEEERFRAEVRAFLAEWSDLDAYLCHGPKWPRVAALFRALGARGWLALAWPAEHGGLGLGPAYEYLLWDEVAGARAARSPLLTIVARTLLRAGTEAQRAAWLPKLRAGALHFALGYSEPEAGSDLAGLRTRAERRGDAYVVSGDKCWQSYAGHVDHLWLLARTGEPGSRGGGLSLFIVDRSSPGLEITPLPTLDGDALYACRFDGVVVPAERRIGPEHGAWQLMAEALADERHIQFPAGRLRRDLVEVEALVARAGRADDPLVRRGLAELSLGVLEAEVLALRVVELTEAGRGALAEAAANKVFHTELCQRIAGAAFAWGGVASLVAGDRAQQLWLQSLWETIGGGTSEVMRGVVAKQALGLGGRG